MASKKRYWRSIEELQDQSIKTGLAENEFSEELPVNGFLENKETLESSKTSRRDFLKYLGFSTAAATLAACEGPIVKSVPYVVKPEEITPGVPTYYATSMYDGYDYANVIVKTREGRPIKLDPNKGANYLGDTNARAQASVLSLYDTNRLKTPKINGEDSTWDKVDAVVVNQLNSLNGKKAVIITPSLPSPSTKNLIKEFQAKYTNVEHVVYDAVDYTPALDASEESYGVRALPVYDISNSKLVVSFNADFLNDWEGVSMEKEFVSARKPGKSMLRHIQVESNLSLTGANSDSRFPVKPSKVYKILSDVYSVLTGGTSKTNEGKVIADEIKSKGSDAVVFADGNKDAYVIANAINSLINSTALTGKWNLLKESNISKYKEFLKDAKNGNVGALFIYESNLVEHSSYGKELLDVLKKIPISVAMNSQDNDTSKSVNVVAPVPHWLECWGDFNPITGEYYLQQPTIQQIFKTRQLQDSLITWMGSSSSVVANNEESSSIDSIKLADKEVTEIVFGDDKSYYSYLKKYWANNILNGKSFNQALYDGGLSIGSEVTEKPDFIATEVEGYVSSLNSHKESDWELQLYTKIGIGDGRQANNPWLQEFPDPITRTSWDNYLTMNPVDAEALGIEMWNDGNERNGRMQFNGPYYTVTINGESLTIPVFIQPGQAKGSLGLALGYGVKGRIAEANDLEEIGVNAYPFFKDGVKSLNVDSLEPAGGSHEFANVQMMNTLMGRYEIAREVSLEDFINKPSEEWNEKAEMDTFAGNGVPVEEVTLWRNFDRSVGPHFKLSIDLNSCTGCGACVIACHAENNVPVVGKAEVRRSRDMHWLRIDRYYSDAMSETEGKAYPYTQKEALKDEDLNEPEQYKILVKPAVENPDVIFQPMMCQHCNHAPCETVCPVAATSHGKQGQNQMAYNRCIGTRYCANNCPYKVRRFNWFNYAQNDKFDFNMNNDLGRMVLNPDVVVRQRGVMEKCSFCIQSTQAAILEAKKDGRRVTDEEFNDACACSTACSTGSMRFGDVNDPEAKITELEKDIRKYEVLEEVGTKPNVFYHVKVRNRVNN